MIDIGVKVICISFYLGCLTRYFHFVYFFNVHVLKLFFCVC